MKWFLAHGPLIIGWSLFVIQFLYYHVDKIYWYFQKVKYTVLNPDTQWDLSIRYKVPNLNTNILKPVQAALIKVAVFDRPEIRIINANRFEIRADVLTIEVAVDEYNDNLSIFFRKIPVSFRGSQSTINDKITPIIELLENRITAENKSYWLTVYFGNMNPYFGLYMRRLKQRNVSEMNIRVQINKEEELKISKQKMTLRTISLSALGNGVRQYLTLSKLPA